MRVLQENVLFLQLNLWFLWPKDQTWPCWVRVKWERILGEFYDIQLIKCWRLLGNEDVVGLLPTSVNLGRITWIMETNIWLLALMFVLNIQIFDIYIWLLVKPKSLFQVTNMISEVELTFPLQIQICFILPYNQIIKTNNQIFKITVLRIRPRLTDVGSKD